MESESISSNTIRLPVYFGGPRCGETFGNPSWIIPPHKIRLPNFYGTYVLRNDRYIWIQDAD